MPKAINLRFVCWSLATFAIVGLGVYFLHKWQVRRQTGIFLAMAQEAETSGNLVKAINSYGQYLALAPRDADAQARYGLMLFEARAYARASQAFEAVLRVDPGAGDVRRKVVKADIFIDRVPDARDHLENYLLKQFPDDAELLDLEGRCLARDGEYLAAGRSFAAAIQHDPARTEAYTQLIAILLKAGRDLDKDREVAGEFARRSAKGAPAGQGVGGGENRRLLDRSAGRVQPERSSRLCCSRILAEQSTVARRRAARRRGGAETQARRPRCPATLRR